MSEETKTPPQEQEIDFDRIKNGDEAYTREVNKRLAKEAAEPPQPAGAVEQEPPKQEQAAAPPLAGETLPTQPEEDFFTFEDGDPIYKGQPFRVKKSELKAYVQKGRHLEVRLSELQPYINVVKNNPELAEAITRAAHDPQGAEQLRRIGEALKTGKVTPQVEEDLADLDLPGFRKDDVEAVARIQMALQKKQEAKRREVEERQMQEELVRRDQAATAMVNGLRMTEGPVFDQVRPLMQQRIQQLRGAVDQGVLDEAQFNQFVIGLTDPTATDDQGTPLFLRFYRDIKAEMSGQSAAPPPQQQTGGQKPPPTNNSRLAPGSAGSPAGRSGEAGLDWANMPQAEFDRRMQEKLASI